MLSDCQYLPQYFRCARLNRCQPFSVYCVRCNQYDQITIHIRLKHACVNEQYPHASASTRATQRHQEVCMRNSCFTTVYRCSWLSFFYLCDQRDAWHQLADYKRRKFYSQAYFKWRNLLKICGCCIFVVLIIC